MTDLPFAHTAHALGDVVLRPLVESDVDTLAARVVALDPWARVGTPASAMRARMLRPWPATHRFAVVADGATAGYVSVRWPFMRGAYLETIAIFPEAQRSGLARRVLDWMAAEIAGVEDKLWLCVTEWNASARATYAALGFVEIAPVPDLAALGQSEIFMRRVLAPPRL